MLYSDLSDPDWPDNLDLENGTFTYYGDNKSPGRELHETPKSGNLILREMFALAHAGRRSEIPPVFVFTKGPAGRDVVFRGLAIPGVPGVSQTEDLVAIWKVSAGSRFQNYRALFTILDVPDVPRVWLHDLRNGGPVSVHAPPAWLEWRRSGVARPLKAEPSRRHRTAVEQLPSSAEGRDLLASLVSHYRQHPRGPYAFERCAAEIFKLMERNVRSVDLTRPWRDGGRDAIGTYSAGQPPASIDVEFALEAKCKGPESGSGVSDTARLIARLRHRQFGVFVTTSYISEQAYKELVEDGHPVVVVAGRDIIQTLQVHGINSGALLGEWLASVDAH